MLPRVLSCDAGLHHSGAYHTVAAAIKNRITARDGGESV